MKLLENIRDRDIQTRQQRRRLENKLRNGFNCMFRGDRDRVRE